LPKSLIRKAKPIDAHITLLRILTIDEQKVYLMACAQPLRHVASLMAESGLRTSEVLNLKRDDISIEQEITC
jgi:integrase